ncbi:MAG: efflux RND transporter permease subunit, partial [Alphaproteobacteria bacterium]|nr:efflux RND transporter permease subunit [Alphaproteobacteria bacterium]
MMDSPIDWAMKRSRMILLTLVFLLIAGATAYQQIPKEASPDISIPIGYVSMTLDGISPSDAERMLVKPMEQELKSLKGLNRLKGNAYQGGGSVVAHFDASIDIDLALDDMRKKVEDAISKLPDDVKRPKVSEVNLSLAPVLVVSVSGDIAERALLNITKRLQDELEAMDEVLEVNLRGARDEVIEIIVDPLVIQSYDIPLETVIQTVRKHNQIVPAGALDTGAGRFSIELPSLFEEASAVSNLPLVARDGRTIRLEDIATVQRSFKDFQSFARINGKPALTLEIVKRSGQNVIATTEKARAIIKHFLKQLPEQIRIDVRQDASKQIRVMLGDLQNNIITAIILMVAVLIAALGVRGGVLVSVAIPASFVCGILFLFVAGFTVNIVVLFSLILSVGILTDAAVVITEYADRRMLQGVPRSMAYAESARRMSPPIIASTLTTLLAFFPLLFWPDIVGEFMRFMPITMIAVLSASLVIALIFLPVVGAHFERIVWMLLVLAAGVGIVVGQSLAGIVPQIQPELAAVPPPVFSAFGAVVFAVVMHFIIKRFVCDTSQASTTSNASLAKLNQPTVVARSYAKILEVALHFPRFVLLVAVIILMVSYAAYFRFGHGVQFFPEIEPEQINVKVFARGNIAIEEQDRLVSLVEDRILKIGAEHSDFDSVYASSGQIKGRQDAEDIIGVIRLDLKDEELRRSAREIRADIAANTQDIGGGVVQIQLPRGGPPINKTIQVQLISNEITALEDAFYSLRAEVLQIDGLVDIEDSSPKPGIDWIYNIDIRKLEQYQTSPITVGSVLQMATKGLKVGTMRPDNTDEELDIIVRLPESSRTLSQITSLRINTPAGLVPLNNFVLRDARASSDIITREDTARVMTIGADLLPGVLANDKIKEIEAVIAELDLSETIRIKFKGEEEKQNKSQQFLLKALAVALFSILVVLLVQFNSFMQSLLILSAIIMSTVGVMLGHLLIAKPFSIVMSGIGVIALAGIVVNNNIILIDTFNHLKQKSDDLKAVLIQTGTERLRPVLLTTLTTALGLLPSVFEIQVDFIERNLSFGGASGQWWQQLSASIFYGLL